MRRDDIASTLAAAHDAVVLLGVLALDLDWETLAVPWARRLETNPAFTIRILCESDNFLFAKAFTSDTDSAPRRRSFAELTFVRNRAFELIELLRLELRGRSVDRVDDRVTVEIMYLSVPVSVARADSRTFVTPSLDQIDDEFHELTSALPWATQIERYLNSYLSPESGLRFAAAPGDEALELYDHARVTRGIYPRASFYDTDFSQLVVWALIFDRRGRLLIHRRSDNAKDNRSMWDKSVGGHVDFSLDIDSSRTAMREVIEELFEEETHEDGFRPFTVKIDDMIHLGDWRPEQRRRLPFAEISRFEREWALFRLGEPVHVYSPRTLPDKRTRRLRVIADVFLIVANERMSDGLLAQLKNSQYRLLEVTDLKNFVDRGLRGEEVSQLEKRGVPKFTPDLVNIMTGHLRDVLEQFAQNIKRYVGK